jgi:hypothetical protein
MPKIGTLTKAHIVENVAEANGFSIIDPGKDELSKFVMVYGLQLSPGSISSIRASLIQPSTAGLATD